MAATTRPDALDRIYADVFDGRSTQDLLAERGANVNEARRETDATAIAMLNAHVAMIDVELKRRRVCPTDHAALKADAARWSALPHIGTQRTPEDEFGPAEDLELRNCNVCHSTLAKLVEADVLAEREALLALDLDDIDDANEPDSNETLGLSQGLQTP